MVTKVQESIRYWVNWALQNRIAIASVIVALGGWNGWQWWEKSELKESDLMLQSQITQMAVMMQAPQKVPREIIEKHYIEPCKCSELIHKNNVKYHGVKP